MFRYNIVTGFSISLKRSQFHWYHLAVLYLEICVKTLNFKFCQLFSHTKNPSYMLVRVLNTSRLRVALRKMQKFYLIFWCRNFVEKHRFPPKLYGNRPFQQNFNTMKLGEILVFQALCLQVQFKQVDSEQLYPRITRASSINA